MRGPIWCAVALSWLSAVSIDARAAVGRTPTTFDVSPSGEASYSIPIFAPPGTHGMTPSLSLTYSSRGGSGWIGEGWAIGGFSVISRCVLTWAQDGAPRNVRLDYNDRYCLDGNRLRLVAGSHGASGAEYRTEIETFARIKSYGVAGNGPERFEVEMKNGLTYEYGNTPDSRIESRGVPTARSWAVNKIRDRSGNAILFGYTEDATNGSYRIANVRYTENFAQGLSAAYMVEFVYETQPPGEIDSGYLGGSLIRDVTRLTRVDVTYNAGLVRRYNVAYEPGLSNTGKSRVQSIQECAGSGGSDCLPATTFVYQNGTIGVGSQVSSGTTVVAANAMPLDVNGDGRSDVVYSSSSGSGVWMVMFANSSGGFNAPINSGIANTNFGQAIPIDYNADGLEDFLVPYSGGTWWVVQGTTSGLAGPTNTGVTATGAGGNARAMDVNGDGLDDLVYAIVTGPTHSVQVQLRVWDSTFGSPSYLYGPVSDPFIIVGPVFGVSQFASKTRSPDFNGDGLSDFVVHVREADGEPGIFYHTWYAVLAGDAGTVYLSNFNTVGGPYWPDLNGDGCSDAVYTYNSYWRYRFSGCSGLGPEHTGPIMSSAILQTQAAVFDWDNDGYDDIVGRSTTTFTWHYMRSTGESLGTAVDSGVSHPINSAPYAGDANGDGLDDLLYVSGSVWAYTPHAGVKPDLLQTATDGFGNFVTLNYAALPNANYTKYADAAFPEQDYQGPLYVVNTAFHSDGIGGSFRNYFHYYGARVHLQGRGFEGFYLRYSDDNRNSLYQYHYFHRTFPYTGTLFQTESRQPSGTLIQLATNNWHAHSYGAAYETRHLPFVQSSAAHSYEVGGAFNAALVRSVSVSNSVDATTGTLYDSTTTTSEPASANGVQSGANYVQRTYHPLANLFNDYTNWCFGRPGVTQQINSHNLYGGGAQTRQVNTSWNGAFCRPTQQQLQPGDPLWQVTVDLGYDGYGNPNSQTMTGIGMPGRATTSVWAAPGSFPTSISRPVSASFWESTQKSWNYALGVQASETDPNGILTSWQYDNFGRRTLETRADGTDTVTTYNDCATFGCLGSNNKMLVIEQMRDTADAAINDRWTYFDKFDRAFVTTTRQLSGAWDRTEVSFDALGRVSQRNAPCWWVACTYYWTAYQYDLLNRPTQESRPVSDSDPTIQTSYVYYEGATMRAVDAQAKQKTTVVNALGAPARSTDHAGYYQSFDFDAFGNTIRVMDSSGNTLQSATFNIRGMKLTSSDLDAGNWSFTPNALGELASQTDANAKTTNFTWDFQSRPLTRVFPEGGGSITSTWTWGQSPAAKDIGKLASTQISGTGLTTYGEVFTFDSLGRPGQTQVTEGPNVYNVDVGYSPTTGFMDTLTYPTSTSGYRLKLQYEYQFGYLLRVKDFNAPTTVFWQGNATDARGLVTDETLGNGLRTTKSFDLVTGWVDYVRTGPGGGTTIQNLSYLFDKVGNLTQRQDGNQSLTESFFYDDLYRLDYSTLNSLTNLNVDYDALGNITFKSDVGSYTYHATKKHAVVTAGPYGLTYDANGNLISTTPNSGTATWYANNLPRTIAGQGSLGPTSSEFFYGPDQLRWKQLTSYAGVTEETIYIAGILEKVTQGTVTAWKHYIAGGSGPAALYIRKSDGGESTHYFARDHLGSVDSISDAAGAVHVRLSYSAFGRRRNGAGWSGEPPGADFNIVAGISRRGFTDHEMLDNLSLVHMNGRVYDPRLGRFISADPFIDGVMDTQGWNRYSYVKNNPLSFADPTGFDTNPCPPSRCKPRADPPRRSDPPMTGTRIRGYATASSVTCAGNCGSFNALLFNGGDSAARTAEATAQLREYVAANPHMGEYVNRRLHDLGYGDLSGAVFNDEVLVMGSRSSNHRRAILGDTGLELLEGAPGHGATDCLVRSTTDDKCSWGAGAAGAIAATPWGAIRSAVARWLAARGTTRALQAADFGAQATAKVIEGTLTVQGRVATVAIRNLEGNLGHYMDAINGLKATARAAGATSLRIEGTIGNPALLRGLERVLGPATRGVPGGAQDTWVLGL